MKCYWGCGWEGTPSQYSEHYNICPAKVCPKCGSTNIFFYRVDEIECLQCGNKWKKGEVVKVEEAPPPEEKVVPSKTFKTEGEFRDWLRKHKLTAEPRPGTGLFKNGDRVGSYFETDEGIQVDLAEDAKTWLIRDEVFVEVEEEAMVEKPLETPVEEEAGEPSGETVV